MTAVVFVGPTISEADVLSVVDAICLPPVAQGDVYRALVHNPTCIGIIDGYFDGVAAVWHKEILWALSQGVHVFGASSMGALRAAELTEFGMVGVGTIFDQFRSGKLEDDDEVAVIHGPPELGFPTLSEPLVNIRATLERAVRENILLQIKADELTYKAKSMRYRQRTWDNLVTRTSLPDNFADWLKEGRTDQKHLDAVAMLQAIGEKVSDDSPKHAPSFDFEWTNQWDRAIAQWDQDQTSVRGDDQLVLDEIRLYPDAFSVARDAAMLRYMLIHQSGKRGTMALEKVDLIDAINSFRMDHNLLNRNQLNQWLAANRLTTSELENLLANEVRVKNSVDFDSDAFMQCLVNHLKLTGGYRDLESRAKNKRDQLVNSGQSDPGPDETGLPKPALLEWYFCQKLEKKIPSDIDQYARDLSLHHRDEFYQILAREYLYLHGGEREKMGKHDNR